MNPINTGGPAFPVAENFDERRGVGMTYASEGMTLRDYFAAKVMQANIFATGVHGVDEDEIAQTSYDIADAMIRARTKP